MLRRSSTLLLTLGLWALPAAAWAQSSVPRADNAVRLSVGYGYAGPAAVVDTDRHNGPVLALGLEHTLAPNLRALGELTRWQSTGVGSSSTTFAIASVELFPVQGTDAYLRAGLGYGTASLYAPTIALNGGSYSVSGPAIQIGGGYDYRTSNALTVGAFLLGTNTIGGTAKSKVRHGSGEAALISLGLSLTWRP